MKPENRLIYFLCTSPTEKRKFSSLYSLALQIRSFHYEYSVHHCSVSAGGGKVLVSSKVTFPDSLVITVIFNIVRGYDNG
jgi:hypothetical protein